MEYTASETGVVPPLSPSRVMVTRVVSVVIFVPGPVVAFSQQKEDGSSEVSVVIAHGGNSTFLIVAIEGSSIVTERL